MITEAMGQPATIGDILAADPRVRAMLDQDAELFAVVREAVEQLRFAFDDAPVEVHYFEDHDDEQHKPQVTVLALPRMPFDRACEIFEDVGDRWWAPNMNRAGGRFALAVHPIA